MGGSIFFFAAGGAALAGAPLAAGFLAGGAALAATETCRLLTAQANFLAARATEAGTNTLDVKILGQLQSPGNELGSAVGTGAANGQYLVKLNRTRLSNQVAGV